MLLFIKFLHHTLGIKRGFSLLFILAAITLINVPFLVPGVTPIFKLLSTTLGFAVVWFLHSAWKTWTEEQILNELGFSIRDIQPQESPQQ